VLGRSDYDKVLQKRHEAILKEQVEFFKGLP